MTKTEENLEKSYDKESEIYDRTRYECKGGKYYFDMETRHLTKILKYGNILELGCGTGQFTVFLAKNGFENITGIDLSEGMLNKAKKKAKEEGVESKIKFIKMNVQNLDSIDETFDNVIAIRCFRFLGVKALKEAYRVLKPKGRIVIMDLSADYIYNKIPTPWKQLSEEPLMHVFSLKELENEFKNLGLRLIYKKSFYIFPPPLYYHAPQFILNFINKFDDKFKGGRLAVVVGEK